MSEEIKAGMMVWGIGAEVENFSPVKLEYIGYDGLDEMHALWNGEKNHIVHWTHVTTTNPHAPKVPEWMPGGEFELWESSTWGSNDETRVYKSNDTTHTYSSPEVLTSFHSFAVKAGDGTVRLMNTPNWYTKEGSSLVWTRWEKGEIKAEILGAVIRKAADVQTVREDL